MTKFTLWPSSHICAQDPYSSLHSLSDRVWISSCYMFLCHGSHASLICHSAISRPLSPSPSLLSLATSVSPNWAQSGSWFSFGFAVFTSYFFCISPLSLLSSLFLNIYWYLCLNLSLSVSLSLSLTHSLSLSSVSSSLFLLSLSLSISLSACLPVCPSLSLSLPLALPLFPPFLIPVSHV